MPTLGGTTMKTLREVLQDAEYRRAAVGHFNFSELTVLKAVGEAARAYGRMQLRRRPRYSPSDLAEFRKRPKQSV